MVILPWLAVLVAPGLRSRHDLEYVIKTCGILGIGVAILGAFQFYLPPNHYVNRQPGAGLLPFLDGGRVRASGTFAFITGMASMALTASWAGVYFVLTRPRWKRGYIFILGGLTCASAALSRGGLFFSMALVAGVMLLTRRRLWSAVLLAALVAVLWFGVGGDDSVVEPGSMGLVEGTLVRHHRSDTVSERAGGLILGLWEALQGEPLGMGLGAGQVAESGSAFGRPRARRLRERVGPHRLRGRRPRTHGGAAPALDAAGPALARVYARAESLDRSRSRAQGVAGRPGLVLYWEHVL